MNDATYQSLFTVKSNQSTLQIHCCYVLSPTKPLPSNNNDGPALANDNCNFCVCLDFIV